MARTPTLHMVGVDQIEIAVWEWAGSDPPIVLAHATGFMAVVGIR